MNIDDAMTVIEDTGLVFDIGQLDADCKRALNRRVRRKELARIRTLWPWIHAGTIEKTAYCFPHHSALYAKD
jgi:hypothetical protein